MRQLPGFALLAPCIALAGQLTYQPINPSFGGNPINGSYLMQNAGAQNDHTGPQRTRTTTSSLDRFTSSLQSRLTSQFLSDIQANQNGTLITDEFEIVVSTDLDGTLNVSVIDRADPNNANVIQVQPLTTNP